MRTGNMPRERFVQRAQSIHTTAYDYSTLEYTNLNNPAYIVCPKHGRFKFNPNGHIRRKKHESAQGCPDCTKYRKYLDCAIEYKEFIKKAISIHGYFYDYSKVTVYQGRKDKAFGANVTNTDRYYVRGKDMHLLSCPVHGDFKQTISNHTNVNNYSGCPKCGKELISFHRLTTLHDFVYLANIIHKGKYNYKLIQSITVPWHLKNRGLDDTAKYVNTHMRQIIICPVHGSFPQKLYSHVETTRPKGCKKCAIDALRDTTESFITKSIEIHGTLYDYSLVQYTGSQDPVNIICSKHGVFSQIARDHITGCGCPDCGGSRGEAKIKQILQRTDQQYIQQQSYEACRNILPLPFDFYLPEYDILLEYNGIQHYQFVQHFHRTLEGFEEQKRKDKIKKAYAEKHHNFLEIPYWDFDNIESILKEKLAELEIKK